MGIENQDDGLTDEERAALNEDDGDGAGDGAGEGGTNNEGGGDGGEAGAAGDGDGATDGAAAAGAAGAGGDQGGEPNTEQPAGQAAETAPILIAQAPADADAKLTEIATKKEELLTKFDDGDITAKEFQKELDALAKQEREIERAQDKAQIAADMEAQRQANDWKTTVDAFIRDNARYNPEKNESMYKLLDLEVRRVATTDEFKGRSDSAAGREILQRAHELLAKELGFEAKPQAKPQAKKPDLPPNLAKVPASEQNDTNGGKYAVLDRLAQNDPIAYEEALMKLPEGERNAYLAA